MTDNNDDKTLNAPAKKTLTLKPGGMNQGTVRQDMGRGRTNAVVVETRKRRPLRPEDGSSSSGAFGTASAGSPAAYSPARRPAAASGFVPVAAASRLVRTSAASA